MPGYSNQYTPRSSPGKFEINPQLFHPSWSRKSLCTHKIKDLPLSHFCLLLAPPSFPSYETQERYSQPQYNNYYPSSRTPPPISGIQHDPHRKLPRLATNTGCYTPSHIPSSSNYTTSGTVHSPASYQTEYDYSTSSHHGYTCHNMHSQEYDDHPYVPSMNTHGHMTTYEGLDGHRSNHGHRPSPPPSKSSSQPLSISPTDDSTVKKKRKRADPAQLKVLNETYNRTAFPSTEERLELAKALDMTPRSVQIWCVLRNIVQVTRLISYPPKVSEQETIYEADQPSILSCELECSAVYNGKPG